MKYALVDNEKTEPFPNGKGICQCCLAPTIAKCGSINIHHWAHKSKKQCDNWWENETDWHRDWKSHFPVSWQEIIHYDKLTNEKHIADIKTSKGVVIELQNSPMNIGEMQSREQFYKNMVWVVNGLHFMSQFHILNKLPDPRSEFSKDLVFLQSKKSHYRQGSNFYRKSENEDDYPMKLIHSTDKIQKEIEANYAGHHLFDWVRPRTVWYNAKCPVVFDFGETLLWQLVRHNKELFCIKSIDKIYFINRAKKI